MTQQRFIGVSDDITQEVLLLATQSVSRAKVLTGLQASIHDTTTNTLEMWLEPGTLIMPDGMIVQETEIVKFPLIQPTGDPTKSTLVAYRPIDPGLLSNELRYRVISGWVTQQTMEQSPALIQMPLAWISKNISNPNANSASIFSIQNLGERNLGSVTKYSVPISRLCTPLNVVPVLFDSDIKSLKHVVDPRSFNRLWFRIDLNADEMISEVAVTARSNPSAQQKILFKSLNAPTNYATQLTKTLDFSNTLWVTRTIVYPVASLMQSDILQLDIATENTLLISPANNFELLEIVVTKVRLFG